MTVIALAAAWAWGGEPGATRVPLIGEDAPVCTMEFMTQATMRPEFEALRGRPTGLSIDRVYSHVAWRRTIKEKLECRGMITPRSPSR